MTMEIKNTMIKLVMIVLSNDLAAIYINILTFYYMVELSRCLKIPSIYN